jgi:hypothetical protein
MIALPQVMLSATLERGPSSSLPVTLSLPQKCVCAGTMKFPSIFTLPSKYDPFGAKNVSPF